MLTHIDDLLLSLTRSMKKVPKEIAWDCLRDRVRREPQGRSAYLCILLAGDLRLTCSREDLRRLGLSRNGPAYIRWVAALALTHLDDWSAEVALWEGIESGDVLPPDAEFMDAEHVASHRESWRGHTVCRLALGPSPAGRVRRFCELFRDPRIGKEATRAIAKVLGSFKDDPLALSSLEEALGDKSRPSTVRWQCAESLGLQGHRSSLAALAKALEDEGWGVRASAAEAIGSIIGQGFQATDEGIEQARRWLAEQKDLR
jgi:hypothetical protein